MRWPSRVKTVALGPPSRSLRDGQGNATTEALDHCSYRERDHLDLSFQHNMAASLDFVPPEFSVPRALSTPLFELSVLAPHHAEADYEAVMSSRSAQSLRVSIGCDVSVYRVAFCSGIVAVTS